MRPEVAARSSASADIGQGERRAWTLHERGLVVFERAVGPAGPFRLLVTRPTFCVERRCECRDVMLTAVGLEIATDLVRSGLASEQLESMLAGTHVMNAAIAVDVGRVTPDDYAGRAPLSSEWVEYLQSVLDGELLDHLYDEWLRAKGFRGREPHEIDWPAREPSELVGWHEAYPEARPDLYVDDDAVFMAEELYCVNPRCDCEEAVVGFSEMEERDSARSIGHVRARLSDAKVLDVRGSRRQLERLWSAYRARHRAACNRFSDRKRRMAEIAKLRDESHAPRTVVVNSRVGRNDPCPCGSGKKYKRCCAGRQALGFEGNR
jgi:SEC-C motif